MCAAQRAGNKLPRQMLCENMAVVRIAGVKTLFQEIANLLPEPVRRKTLAKKFPAYPAQA